MTPEELNDYLRAHGWRRTIEQTTFKVDPEPRQVFNWRHEESGRHFASSQAAEALAAALSQQAELEGEPSPLELRLGAWLEEAGWSYSRSWSDRLARGGEGEELHVYERQLLTLEEALAGLDPEVAARARAEAERRSREQVDPLDVDAFILVPASSLPDPVAGEADGLVPLFLRLRSISDRRQGALSGAVQMQLVEDGYDIDIYEPPTRAPGEQEAGWDPGGLAH